MANYYKSHVCVITFNSSHARLLLSLPLSQKNQLLNGGYVPDPQGAVPEGSYNPYGVVHTHHRTAQGTVTTTTTVC